MTNDVSQLREQRLPETLEVLFTGRILRLERYSVRQYSGRIAKREVVRHPGGVCVVALDGDGMVAMVRQYRFPIGEHLLELPAGKLEPGEEPLPAAKRELSEETGLEADEWRDLGFIYTSPGFSTERLYLYLATGLHHGAQHLDLNEFLDVEYHSLESLRDMVLRGEIADGKTVAGVLKTAATANSTAIQP